MGKTCEYIWKYGDKAGKVCDLEAAKGSRYCIWHTRKDDKDYPSGARAFLFERVQEGLSLEGFYLPGINLRKVDFSKAFMPEIYLSGADLRGSTFHKAHMFRANLKGVDAAGTKFNSALLQEATFNGADLTSADFSEANLIKVHMRRTNLFKTNFWRADLSNADFDSAELNECNFVGAKFYRSRLINAVFNNCLLWETTFEETELSEANLNRCEMQYSKMAFTRAEKAKFDQSDLKWVNITNSNLSRASFRHACLINAILESSDLGMANFWRADISGAKLKKVDVSYTEFLEVKYDLNTTVIDLQNLKNAFNVPANWFSLTEKQTEITDIPILIIFGDTKYEIVEIIGAGSFGKIYKVRNYLKKEEFKAIKHLNIGYPYDASTDKEILRFKRELEVSKVLVHKNIVQYIDYMEKEGNFYLLMEYIDGTNLRRMIVDRKFGDRDKILDIFLQICAGLNFAHSRGILHRDLKPENIMVTKNGIVKIIDFGLATFKKFLGSKITSKGILVGTPSYSSPESLRGKEIDYTADIFALGIILYEMLTGTHPFRAKGNIAAVITNILLDDPEPPSQKKNGIPQWLDELTMKALSKEPKERPQSVREIMEIVKDHRS